MDRLEHALCAHGILRSLTESKTRSTPVKHSRAVAGGRHHHRFGRVLDNIFVKRPRRSRKHEDVCLERDGARRELLLGLTEHIAFYNDEGPTRSCVIVLPITTTARGSAADHFVGKNNSESMSCN